MSDGAEEKKTEGEQTNPTNKNGVVCPDDYSRGVARVAVAQICEGIGFEAVKHSALDALTDITVRYISDLAESSRYYSNLAARSDSNLFDIVKGLEDLTSTRGFMGASSINPCSTASGALKELLDFVATVEEIPFAQPIPKFPVTTTNSSLNKSLSGSDEPAPNRKHIPEWVPPFPEPHTYLHSPVWNDERRGDNNNASIKSAEHVRQRRKAESSLLRLQQRLLAATSAPSTSANLFLAPPLPAGEREVSKVSVPSKLVGMEGNKKHGSFVEVFGPAIDAAKGREVDYMDVDRGVGLLEKRPVCFRLKTGKKMRGEHVDVSLRVRGEERVPVLGMEEERDEKKRRAEQILRQSMAHNVN